MAKIPINSMVHFAKDKGPKAIKIIEENKEIFLAAVPIVSAAAAKLKRFYEDRKITLAEKEHYRKSRYSEYKNNILVNLQDNNRLQLVNYKDEVESFIAQIENEENEEVVLKKPLHTKRRDDWKKVLLQIEDKIRIMDYQEYLKLFNNTTYISNYFEGYDRKINAYKKLVENENIKRIHDFISENTEKSVQSIERDFK